MIKRKNFWLIFSVIFAIGWMIFEYATMGNTGKGLDSADDAEAIGTAIGMALLMPHLIISSIGVLLHTIGGFTYLKGLTLAGIIIECVGVLFGITWGFGLFIAIVLGFIGYAIMKKKPTEVVVVENPEN